jgi:hypothetical protein
MKMNEKHVKTVIVTSIYHRSGIDTWPKSMRFSKYEGKCAQSLEYAVHIDSEPFAELCAILSPANDPDGFRFRPRRSEICGKP